MLLNLSDNANGEVADADSILTDIAVPEIDISAVGVVVDKRKDLFCPEKRAAWDKSEEARCDFSRHPSLTRRNGVLFISLWKKTLYGRTLSEIKGDDDMIEFFANEMTLFISDFLGKNLSLGNWGICTTPRRRHKERNFASLISAAIGNKLSIPYYDDVARCRTLQRINAVFTLNFMPDVPNLIVFDDFVTTGSTLGAMKEMLSCYDKNILYVAGINNKL